MRHSDTKQFAKDAADAGVQLVDIQIQGGGHYKLTIKREDGQTMFFFTSATSSDHRTIKNRVARFKRFAADRLHHCHSKVTT